MTEVNGIFVPSIWSHDGVIDYFYPTEELKARVCKDKAVAEHFAAHTGRGPVTIPTRRALTLAIETYALDITDTKLPPDDIVPLAEWHDCTAKVEEATKPLEPLPLEPPTVEEPPVKPPLTDLRTPLEEVRHG